MLAGEHGESRWCHRDFEPCLDAQIMDLLEEPGQMPDAGDIGGLICNLLHVGSADTSCQPSESALGVVHGGIRAERRWRCTSTDLGAANAEHLTHVRPPNRPALVS
jgi:hypothetical protein